MTLQAGDPHALLDPKVGWSEQTGRGSFHLVLSADEVRLARARELVAKMGAFLEVLEDLMARDR